MNNIKIFRCSFPEEGCLTLPSIYGLDRGYKVGGEELPIGVTAGSHESDEPHAVVHYHEENALDHVVAVKLSVYVLVSAEAARNGSHHKNSTTRTA